MIQVSASSRILVALAPVDFRRGIDGLAALCRSVLRENPLGGTLFVFRSRSGTSLRLNGRSAADPPVEVSCPSGRRSAPDPPPRLSKQPAGKRKVDLQEGRHLRILPPIRLVRQGDPKSTGGEALRILVHDGQGFWLCTKRLSAGRFRHWPTRPDAASLTLMAHELALLLAGGDPSQAKGAPLWRPLSPSGCAGISVPPAK